MNRRRTQGIAARGERNAGQREIRGLKTRWSPSKKVRDDPPNTDPLLVIEKGTNWLGHFHVILPLAQQNPAYSVIYVPQVEISVL